MKNAFLSVSTLLFIVSSCVSVVCQASTQMVGDNIFFAKERDNPSVCQINISNYDGNGLDGECTGTLVSPTEVYTAAHCFGRHYDSRAHSLSVYCGGKSMKRTEAEIKLPDSGSDALWLTDREPKRTEDFAVIRLVRATTQIPSPVSQGPELYFNASGALLPGIKCKMLGYGTNDINGPEFSSEGVPNIGFLVQADLKELLVTYSSAERLIKILPLGTRLLTTSCGAGDSGGPLFCQAPGRPFELMGTVVLRQHAHDVHDHDYIANVINPVWFHVH